MKNCVLLTIGFIFFQAPALFGQCEKASIDSASVDKDSARVTVAFSQPLATSGPSGIVWTVLDASSQLVIAVNLTTIAYHVPDQYSNPSSATFQLNAAIIADHTYFVTATNLFYDNCPSSKPSTASAKLTVGKSPEVSKKSAFPFTIFATKGRDDSDLYLSGLIQGADGTQASYTADVKAQIQVPIKSAATSADNKFRAGWWFVPSFDFKASTDPKSDGNSVAIAAAIAHGFQLSKGFFTWDEIAPGFVIESDKQYRAINSLASLRTDLLMRSFGNGQLQLYLQPFAVLVAGDNTRSPLAGAFPGGIVRPGAGVHVYLNLFKAAKPGRRAFIENEYVRRWPLLSEPIFSQDKSGNLSLVSIGTNPRDYVWTKFEFDFTDYFGLTFGHDYGKLPPVYTKVDNKYSVGLVLKSGLKYKPK